MDELILRLFVEADGPTTSRIRSTRLDGATRRAFPQNGHARRGLTPAILSGPIMSPQLLLTDDVFGGFPYCRCAYSLPRNFPKLQSNCQSSTVLDVLHAAYCTRCSRSFSRNPSGGVRTSVELSFLPE